MIKGRDILIYLSVKYKGDWTKIYEAIKSKELVDNLNIAKAVEENTNAITIIDENYPEVFKKIYKPPFVVYYNKSVNSALYIDNFKDLNRDKNIMIAGTNHPNQITEDFIKQFADDVLKYITEARTFVTLEGNAVSDLAYKRLSYRYRGVEHIRVLPRGIKVTDDHTNTIYISEYPNGTRSSKTNVTWAGRLAVGVSPSLYVPAVVDFEKEFLVTLSYAMFLARDIYVTAQPSLTNDLSTQMIKDGAIPIDRADQLLQMVATTTRVDKKDYAKEHLDKLSDLN
jgi:DNA processing protein